MNVRHVEVRMVAVEASAQLEEEEQNKREHRAARCECGRHSYLREVLGRKRGSIVLDVCCRGDGLRALQAKRPPRSPFAKCKLANRALFLRFARFCPRVARFSLSFILTPTSLGTQGWCARGRLSVLWTTSLQATCGNVRALGLACARARLARLFLRKASERARLTQKRFGPGGKGTYNVGG